MPSVVTSSTSQHDDGAEHLAALHLVERLLDVVEGDLLADEAVEVEPPWRYRSISIGKSRDGRQSPYQLDFRAPPRPNTSMNGSSIGRPSGGHADEHDGAGEVAASNAWR